MLLGKRPRLPIKRTASMTGIRAPDLADDVESELELRPSDQINAHDHNNSSALVSPARNSRIQSPRELGQPPTEHFLRTCGLCKRRLAPGRDIYMYRGDTAFCTSECREKQIKEDERREAAASTAGGRVSRKNHTGGGGR